MGAKFGFVTIVATLVLSASGVAADKVFVVKYMSAEHVYLNGGASDGLAIGHRLTLTKVNQCATELEIVYVAERSSSCIIVFDSCRIAVGDQVTLVPAGTQEDNPAPVATTDNVSKSDSVVALSPKATSFAKPAPPQLTGSVALIYYGWNDTGPSNLDFSQTTARLNFKARRLFGREINFSLRTRGRYDQRRRSYNSQVGRDEWENRIWEMSLVYDDPHSAVHVFAGRILPRRVAGAGYLDGLLVESRINSHLKVGLLAGAHPRWAYDSHASSLQKAAGYISYSAGTPSQSYFEQTLAGIGEYHKANVSRELITLQGRFNRASQYGVYHTIELDVNRGWRKERARESFTLSSVYLGGWYRVLPTIRAGISYDNRVNYWTYDTRTTVDSLFDDHLRQGVRGQIDATLPAHFQSSLSYGIRKRQGDSGQTVSYSVSLNKSGLWRNTARVSAQYAGFDGPHELGYNYSARLSDNVSRGLLIGIGYGAYRYKADADLTHRTSRWYEITGQADLGRRYFLGVSAQINTGDDIDGLRLQSEIGWRF